jgi:putative ABC transport system permease protein
MVWLLTRVVWRAPRRLVLAAVGIALPVAILGTTLLLVDDAGRSMTRVSLAPVQVEMRALATNVTVDMNAVTRTLATVHHVRRVDRFASADVLVSTPGAPAPIAARLFAVDPDYLTAHPWVGVTAGSLGAGTLLSAPLRTQPGYATASTVDIRLPGGKQPVAATSVGGTVDLRDALTWISIPIGDTQGDLAHVGNAIVVDYATFERAVLPALHAAADGERQGINANANELPPVSVEAHVTIDHAAYPSDPANASRFSTRMRRILERQAPESIVVADNAAEVLVAAQQDATSAKILFLLLGLPGVLVAGGLGLAAATALAEAQRREDALLELRGATGRQVARLTVLHAAVAGALGAVLGLAAALATVVTVTGHQVWREIPPERLAATAGLALLAGVLTTAARAAPVLRAIRRPDVARRRRTVEHTWTPAWRERRLDLIAIAAGAAILGVTAAAGGLRPTPIEGQTVALAFYVMLAPLALWLGLTLLAVRGLRAALIRRTRPDRERPLSTWTRAALRWLGRRPAPAGAAVVLCALAVAFGTNVLTFVATYQAAQHADLRAAAGADLRITPRSGTATPPPRADIDAVTPIRLVPAQVGTDRKSVLAVDPESYRRSVAVKPRILAGEGLAALARDPMATIVHKEIADGFQVQPGDIITLTIFPDDPSRARNIRLRIAGVFRSFPPDEPFNELVVNAAAIPQPLPPPDFYLAKVTPGRSPATAARGLRAATTAFSVTTVGQQKLSEQRSLTALNLRALGRVETAAAGLVAAVGVAVLGAFLVLERRRESAVLRSVGASTLQVLTGPAVESIVTVLASLAIGLPIGIVLSAVSIRVLGLFFMLPPPLVVIPAGQLAAMAGVVVAASAVAIGATLTRITRQAGAALLREP